ncbi:MAG: helical backbone metal receptor [Candidatus Omnitrophota bacterium]|nr:helical backbone metal receptor [Candidatus Omnitrophota bacterium]
MKKIIPFIFILLLTLSADSEAAYRIISLAPNTTEILFSLGLGDSIVALDNFSNYPEGVRGIERIGTFTNPDMERIILLKPDCILVNSGLEKSKEEYLKGLGIKVMKISPKSMEDLYRDISGMGEFFNKQKEAGAIIEDMRSRIKGVSGRMGRARPRVFVQIFDDPLTTVSFFIGDIIRLAGGENIASDIKDDSGIFSYEALVHRNPDAILVIGFSRTDNFSPAINAVKNNRIYRGLDPDIFLRPGPRSAEAVEKLNEILTSGNFSTLLP